ncbi:mortality factor 4-like protein 1 [Plectropomus leopardus]|uniref:mortality factor 4-like protein 1 n=1 Tax=Plectropomus leopardus TaxID=160734 RepID=UPI001C4B2E53|nr:mortality factor 4-like protein 1 [Plectropomus leopardus]
MAPKQDPKPKFQEGERVLCFHGPLLYEAKCVKINIKDKQIKYFIHYSGWNKNWDEWVPESRVLKYVDSNLQKQKELQRANQDHYVEGRMRGAAPNKKIPVAPQKNDVKTKKNKQKNLTASRPEHQRSSVDLVKEQCVSRWRATLERFSPMFELQSDPDSDEESVAHQSDHETCQNALIHV